MLSPSLSEHDRRGSHELECVIILHLFLVSGGCNLERKFQRILQTGDLLADPDIRQNQLVCLGRHVKIRDDKY